MPQMHSTADVAGSAQIGEGVAIWDYSKLTEDYVLEENVNIGRGVCVGIGVHIGASSKIQDYTLVYESTILKTGVFIGPDVILIDDKHPCAVKPDGTQKNSGDWKVVGLKVGKGASIGARIICVAPVKTGAWALVVSGSTVVKNVPAFALVVGIPAKRIQWVGKSGAPLLSEGSGYFLCPKTGARYLECDTGTLVEVD